MVDGWMNGEEKRFTTQSDLFNSRSRGPVFDETETLRYYCGSIACDLNDDSAAKGMQSLWTFRGSE